MANSATDTRTLTQISDDDIRDLEELLSDLKEKAQRAHDSGALLVHTTYVQLISVVSPIVMRTHARIEREHLAAQRKQLKALRASKRGDTQSES